MKFEIIAVILVICFGVIFVATGMGSGGFLRSFLGAFGLIVVFAFVAMIIFGIKSKSRKNDSE